MADALGLPVRRALLKGRASYLCLHRLKLARQDPAAESSGARRVLGAVERWALITRNGDLAELPALDERSPLVPLVTSTRDNCLGAQCPDFRACHVNLARREALAADVVVINHHLFFADLTVRESGMAELLPSVRSVVFDEAHQLNETGVQFLGSNLSSGQLLDFARDTLAAGLQHARGLVDWPEAIGRLDRAARELRLAAGASSSHGVRRRWTDPVPEGVDAESWRNALAQIEAGCRQAAAALDTVSEIAPDFVRLHERALRLATLAERFAHSAPPDCVRWIDAGLQVRLTESPLDIAHAVRTRLLRVGENDDPAAALEERQRAWIFTSATLGDDARLSWFTRALRAAGRTGAAGRQPVRLREPGRAVRAA